MMTNSETSVPFFQARQITKQYPGTLALDGVNFDLFPGEVHALVGENGAGKSTLMLILAGVLRPDQGSLHLDGSPIQLRDPHDAQKKGISIVFQELALYFNMSVAENIFTNSQPSGRMGLIQFGEMYAQARQSMEAFGIEINPRAPLRNYNLAVQQIVEITRAIHRNARVLLLDEPTSAIGRRETEQLFHVIRSLRDSGVGVVYVSHKLDEVFAISDRITVLKDGKWVATLNTADTSPDQVVHLMVGREFDKLFPERDQAAGKPVLETRNLSGRSFYDVNLTAVSGQVLGLFGLTGAGRTELARAIFGIDPISSGDILLEGQTVSIHSPGQAMRLGIAYIPEDRKIDGLFLEMSLKNNVAATNLKQVSNGEFVNNRRLNHLAEEAIRQLQIKAQNVEQRVKYLSGGNQQKVLFSKWLARNPKVLIADEPTRGVDVGAKADIHALLHDLARNGAAVVMISSELPEIMGLSDRIAVMHEGRLVGQFLPDAVTEEQIVASAIGASMANNH
jgi:ABC-type sugar transport system ATPase subunit